MFVVLGSTDPGVIDVEGLLIPDAGGVFLIALAVHVLAGAVCVLSGAVAAFARKRPGRHPVAGTVYVCGLLLLVVTAGVMAVLRWPHDVHLLLIACSTAALGGAGWCVGRRRPARWMRWHGYGDGRVICGVVDRALCGQRASAAGLGSAAGRGVL